MTRIMVIGAGGQAKVTLDYLESSKSQVIGLLDDDVSLKGQKVNGISVLGAIRDIVKFKTEFDECMVSFGDNKLRCETVSLVKELLPEIKFASIIHPTAFVSKRASIGDGSIIGIGAMVCTNTKIGEHNIINDGAIIEHDCVLDDFVNVAPGAKLASTINIGEKTFIGLGACIIEDLKIGKNSIIGAGAVVLKNIPDGVLAVGIPAEVKKKNG
ncbi:acetyltransferase [Candidatus Woesearchaeota archaeon]|jgi:acetyltransferase EpsM|nr:acetyltransferase [Candidatus Woesearchaeota archaeon]MBT3538440.1 acetyltransferase [Candidatus Woesearchaeota archaeon]MBT4697003.1 acetyltransferase [Candidatus Woesearchaeota archaeon]MBT7106104.1 acetyltransferase [Candidatus Woesearchaeota archaeon]MBT7930998.1 acetyltransferase [Candidatus Woesearchaeota archaeon]